MSASTRATVAGDVADGRHTLASDSPWRPLSLMVSTEGKRISRNTFADTAPESEATEELLQQLLPEQREAFELTQIVGLSYEEAADVIGCPVGTVRSRVARGRAQLLEAVRGIQAV